MMRLLTVLVGITTTLLVLDVEGWQSSSSATFPRFLKNIIVGQQDRITSSRRPPACWLLREKVMASFRRGLSSSLVLVAVWSGHTASAQAQEWELLNGPVTVPDPLILSFRDRTTGRVNSMTLTHPHIIGAGSGGAVFAFQEDNNNNQEILLKVSWPTTSKTVQRECSTLRLLEDAGVQAAERCLAVLPYPDPPTTTPTDPSPPRTMIVVTPYMSDAVASIHEVPTQQARLVAVDQVARTLVQMLVANIITIDVQPLISKTTGQTIFIDMTEAQVLSSSTSYSFLDQTLIASFISEMVTLIPEDYWKVAQTSIQDELTHLVEEEEEEEEGGLRRARVASLLHEQTPFF